MRSLLLGRSLSICALSLLAVALVRADTNPSGEAICAASASPAQALMQVGRAALPSAAARASSGAANDRSPASHSIKVAVGYCVERCYQQFEYCHYRQERHEHCVRRLTACLANC